MQGLLAPVNMSILPMPLPLLLGPSLWLVEREWEKFPPISDVQVDLVGVASLTGISVTILPNTDTIQGCPT